MRRSGVFWGLALLPLWGLAGSLLLLVSLAPFFQLKKGLKALSHHTLPLLICLLLLCLPLLTSPNPLGHVMGFLSRYLLPILLLRAFGAYVQQEGTPEPLISALVWGGVGLSGVGFMSLLLPRPAHWQGLCLPSNVATQACLLDFSLLPVFQAQGFAMNPNILGGLLVLVLPFVWLSFEQGGPPGRFSRKTTVFITLMFGAAILLSASRNAGLAMACLSVCLLLRRRGSSFGRRGRGVIQGAAMALLLGVVCAWGVTQRFSDTGRWAIWKVGLAMVQQNPWTGVGILSVEPMYQQMHAGWPHASHLHNGFLQIVAESGIFAALVLFTYLAHRVYNLWRFSLASLHQSEYGSSYQFLQQKAALTSMLLLIGMSVVDFILLDIRVMVYMTAIVASALHPSNLSVNQKV